jgi:hypothetical protein
VRIYKIRKKDRRGSILDFFKSNSSSKGDSYLESSKETSIIKEDEINEFEELQQKN